MEKNAFIIKIYKNEISYKKRKNKKVGIYKFIPLFIVVFTLSIIKINAFSEITEKMCYVYNPVNSLYSDNSDAIFTSGIFNEKEKLNLVLPIKGAIAEVLSDGTIQLEIKDSIMVVACESGVVEEVGMTNDGVKFIKIKHKLEVLSVIENVDIVGVSKGDVVKSGQDIATAKKGELIRFQLWQNGMIVSNLKLHQSKILWEN